MAAWVTLGRFVRATVRQVGRFAKEFKRKMERHMLQAVASIAGRGSISSCLTERRGGLPRGLRRYLRKLGFTSAELRALRRSIGKADPGGDPRPAALLSDTRIDDAYRIAAAYFRIWAASPQIIAASRLR